jgi:hypothetical protein
MKRLVIAALALAAAGCGTADEVEAPRQPAVEPSRLVVHESRVTDGPVYAEGSVSYLGVGPTSAGGQLDATEVDATGPGAVIYDQRLRPDEYRLVSYQRPCDGNCGYLDPPTDGCTITLELRPGETRDITILVRPGSRCRVTGD